jgi:hypothetical protein
MSQRPDGHERDILPPTVAQKPPFLHFILFSFSIAELFTAPDPLTAISYFCNENQSTCIRKN